MKLALEEAKKAFNKKEVPVGALVADKEGAVIAKAFNLVEGLQDPTAHAEMLAIRKASAVRKSWRLDDCILVTTLEPCPMCIGAIRLARLAAVVYAASDPRMGAAGSVFDITKEKFAPKITVVKGILKESSSSLLKNFFSSLRNSSKFAL